MPDKSPRRERVWLVHWNAAEAAGRARELAAAGYLVVRDQTWSSAALSRLKKILPSAIIVDLSRVPSRGRDLIAAIRSHAAMLRVPIVLVGDDSDGAARRPKSDALGAIRTIAPDAVSGTWARIDATLRRAIANPPHGNVRQSVFAAYAGTPLPKKLGIKANAVVALVNAPAGIAETLGKLPEGAQLVRDARGARGLTLWFVASHAELAARVGAMCGFAAGGGLWIIWAKRGAAADGGLSQAMVREAGLSAEMVDFKISRIDETWAGLRFTRRA
jgi:hypothetical protein